MLLASSRLTVHAMKEQPDGTILADPSTSPEAGNKGPGSTYDQSMVYEGHKMTLEAAKILGKKDPILKTIKDHIGRLDPIIVGDSGQIKEWRQETTYGSLRCGNTIAISPSSWVSPLAPSLPRNRNGSRQRRRPSIFAVTKVPAGQWPLDLTAGPGSMTERGVISYWQTFCRSAPMTTFGMRILPFRLTAISAAQPGLWRWCSRVIVKMTKAL